MENPPLDQNQLEMRQRSRNAAATVFISLMIAALFICFLVFCTPPSLAYIIIVYALFAMITIAVLVITFVRPKLKILAGLITVGATTGTLLAVMNQDFHSKMLVGQLVTGLFVLPHVLLIALIWRKRNK